MSKTTATPPMTPPMIAPIGGLWEFEGPLSAEVLIQLVEAQDVQEPLEREQVSSDAHLGQDGVTSGQSRHRRKIVRRVFSTSITWLSALSLVGILRLTLPLLENSILKIGAGSKPVSEVEEISGSGEERLSRR